MSATNLRSPSPQVQRQEVRNDSLVQKASEHGFGLGSISSNDMALMKYREACNDALGNEPKVMLTRFTLMHQIMQDVYSTKTGVPTKMACGLTLGSQVTKEDPPSDKPSTACSCNLYSSHSATPLRGPVPALSIGIDQFLVPLDSTPIDLEDNLAKATDAYIDALMGKGKMTTPFSKILRGAENISQAILSLFEKNNVEYSMYRMKRDRRYSAGSELHPVESVLQSIESPAASDGVESDTIIATFCAAYERSRELTVGKDENEQAYFEAITVVLRIYRDAVALCENQEGEFWKTRVLRPNRDAGIIARPTTMLQNVLMKAALSPESDLKDVTKMRSERNRLLHALHCAKVLEGFTELLGGPAAYPLLSPRLLSSREGSCKAWCHMAAEYVPWLRFTADVVRIVQSSPDMKITRTEFAKHAPSEALTCQSKVFQDFLGFMGIGAAQEDE